ncbi:MAG TPA: hypothetical protein DDZ51_16555 [Planctomycetaceae bacterium]|nr:hypothetical protein [Planctomycetaceae bacterium]
MKRGSLVVITCCAILSCMMPAGPSLLLRHAFSQDAKSETPGITATEPVALTSGSKVTFKVRGFELKGATEIRFVRPGEVSESESGAVPINVEIKETKDAGQAKGLDNKTVGNTQLVADLTLPADLPAGLWDYVVVTPAGEAKGKVRVLAADSVIDEKEPNNGFREAQELLPGKFGRGSIQSDKDVDVFAFPANAGQQLKITVTSGGPLLMDAHLQCYDSRGQFLAAADDDQSRDPVATFKTQADGIVYICISSAHDIGGEWHSYLLAAEEVK